MAQQPSTGQDAATTLPASLRLDPVHLAVARLDRSVAFYRDVLGLGVRSRDGGVAVVGTEAEDLVVLVEEPGARAPGRHAGLYHFALLYPSRSDLARAIKRVVTARVPIQGAADHGVSEALYLADPDGNGIELYADRPREAWPAPAEPGQRVSMYTVPLDVQGVLGLVPGDEAAPPPPPGLRMGHVHLQVGDVPRALGFYRDILGFELMLDLGSAAFVAAGGYHHHLAVNTWRGEGVGPAPAGTAGLRRWALRLATADEVGAVRERVEAAGLEVGDVAGGFAVDDPWGIPVAIVA